MNLQVQTPCCKRSRRITNVTLYATELRNVTCPKCRVYYQVKVMPVAKDGTTAGWARLPVGAAAVHLVDWMEVGK